MILFGAIITYLSFFILIAIVLAVIAMIGKKENDSNE